jgi:signal transduction histidine kinase
MVYGRNSAHAEVWDSYAIAVPLFEEVVALVVERSYSMNMNMPESSWWSSLWDSGVLAMAVLGPERTYRQANAAMCHLLEADVVTLMAWPYERLGHPLDVEVELDAFVRLAEGVPAVVYQRRFRTAKEGEFTAEVRLCMGASDQVLQVVLPLSQSQIKASSEKIIIQRLDQVGAALSHDAQEAMRHISVHAGLILQRNATMMDERGQNSLTIIESSSAKAMRQIRRLAQFSRLGLPHLDPAPLSLRSLIEAACTAQVATTANVTWNISMVGDIRWHCDPNLVTMAVNELLANALHFRDPVRALQVQVLVTDSGQFCTISIADNGLGIATIDQPRLFRLFATIGSDAGAGVGLAMVQAIAQSHGGEATLVSIVGQGTQVSFTLRR